MTDLPPDHHSPGLGGQSPLTGNEPFIGGDVETTRLVMALHDSDWRVRRKAFQQIAEMGIDAVPAMVDLLGHPVARVRQWATDTIGEMGPDVLAQLGPALDSPDWKARRQVLHVLNNMIHAHTLALRKGRDFLTDSEVAQIVQTLIAAQYDESQTVRHVATWNLQAALGHLDDEIIREEAFRSLTRRVRDQSPRTRSIALTTLYRHYGKRAVPYLLEGLHDGRSAGNTLSRLQRLAAEADDETAVMITGHVLNMPDAVLWHEYAPVMLLMRQTACRKALRGTALYWEITTALRALTEHQTESIREAAIEALAVIEYRG